MTSKNLLFTAFVATLSLNAAAQCRIKDEIMGDHPLKELNARVPDGVMDSKKDKKSANLKKGVAGMQDVPAGTHCHHGQDVCIVKRTVTAIIRTMPSNFVLRTKNMIVSHVSA